MMPAMHAQVWRCSDQEKARLLRTVKTYGLGTIAMFSKQQVSSHLSGLAYIEVVTLTNNIAQGHSEYI